MPINPNPDPLDQSLNNLKQTVQRSLNAKQKGLFQNWIDTWNFYIRKEKKFKPHENIKYNPGDIITVAYGYNVGSEQGGNRPSVVVEDNNHSDKTIMVIPLSSLEENETEEDVHEKNVYLGEIADFNATAGKPKGTKSKALVHQMRAVSKLRIIRPKKEEDLVITLHPDKLKDIYSKIADLYTKSILEKAEEKVEGK